jgi:hypothetical protein
MCKQRLKDDKIGLCWGSGSPQNALFQRAERVAVRKAFLTKDGNGAYDTLVFSGLDQQ